MWPAGLIRFGSLIGEVSATTIIEREGLSFVFVAALHDPAQNLPPCNRRRCHVPSGTHRLHSRFEAK